MKSAIALVLVLAATVSWAQEAPPPPLEPPPLRSTILSVGDAPNAWPVGFNGQAVSWYMRAPREGVTISAHLGNGGGHAYVDAYVTKRIGPDTTESDLIAHTTFDLGYPFDGYADIFTDLDLDKGYYWLILARPVDRAHSSVNWYVAQPRAYTSEGCGVASYDGAQSYTFHSDAEEYIPASKFKQRYEPYAFQFRITALATQCEAGGGEVQSVQKTP